MRHLFLPVLGITLAAACNAPAPPPPAAAAPDTAAVRAAMEPVIANYRAAILAGDAVALNALYTDNAAVVISGVPTRIGRPAILTADSTDFAMTKVSEWNATTNSTADFGGGRAAQTGTWTDVSADKKGAKGARWGRWVTGLTKGDDGAWKISYLMAMIDSAKAVK